MQDAQEKPHPTLTVLYDGSCPLCRREINMYSALTPHKPGHSLEYLDISQASATLPLGGSRDEYLSRFHVQCANGQVLSGAAAFVALWATLPGWRHLASFARLAGLTPLLELFYRIFLKVRPLVQGLAKALEATGVPKNMVADLRSDHAGETGAVWIYRGVLAISRDPGLREFARRHRATEQTHLNKINALLAWPQRSRLLALWRLAGFLTGALPALFGPRAVYATVASVETFVDEHYQRQIDKLRAQQGQEALLKLLQQCQQEECEHRDEAQVLMSQAPGYLLRLWCKVVGKGSEAAVAMARLV